jgi:Family of unknown function (DUF5681)
VWHFVETIWIRSNKKLFSLRKLCSAASFLFGSQLMPVHGLSSQTSKNDSPQLKSERRSVRLSSQTDVKSFIFRNQRSAVRRYVMAEDKKDYDIGYCKPPVRTQFQKGQCANPRGRPKGSQSLRASFEAAMQETVPMTVKGRRKRITKRDLFLKQMWNRAISGHGPSQRIVVQLMILRDAKADKRTEPFVFHLTEMDSKL